MYILHRYHACYWTISFRPSERQRSGPIFKGRNATLLGHFYLWRWDHYVTSKRGEPTALWCRITSRKNGYLSDNAKTRNWELVLEVCKWTRSVRCRNHAGSRILLSKLTVAQKSWNPKDHHRIHTSTPLASILSLMNKSCSPAQLQEIQFCSMCCDFMYAYLSSSRSNVAYGYSLT